MSRHILLVDDDDNLRYSVTYALEKEGYKVSAFSDGQAAWEHLQVVGLHGSDGPHLAILDVLMPRLDGLDLCKRVRTLSQGLPVMFLTSKDEEFDKVLGLELGADDYLTKPFSLRELGARVKALLRRSGIQESSKPEDLIIRGDLVLDPVRLKIQWKSKGVAVTVTEFRILHDLALRPGQVKSRSQLEQAAYPFETFVSGRTMDTHIKRLRKKLSDAAPGVELVETVYGLGYRLAQELS